MDREYPTIHFPPRPVDGPYIEVEHPANHVRDLVKELGEDWPVFDESRGGVGVDPWGYAVLISVPFTLFFSKFVELAAADAYGTLKSWLHKMNRGPGYIELRDNDHYDSRRIETPVTDDNLRSAVADQIVAAMVMAGQHLEAANDSASIRQAKTLYQAAAEVGFVGYENDLAVSRLIRLLRQSGDARSLKEAEAWYRRAAEMGIAPARLEEVAWRSEAHKELNRLRALHEEGLLSKEDFRAKVDEVVRGKP